MTAPLQLRDYACAKMRRRLDSYLAGELSVDLSHEILEHLDRCPECRAESDAREKLRASFRRVAGATPGPRDGFDTLIRDHVRPIYERWKARCEVERLLVPQVVYGYFRCQSEGNDLIVHRETGGEPLRFTFPRQPGGRGLCLADFFASTGARSRPPRTPSPGKAPRPPRSCR